MLDIAAALHAWCREGRDFAVATIAATSGSAPRLPGAALAVDAGGAVTGSVSGGCVEGAVYDMCREALRDGAPRVASFGPADAETEAAAFAVGLTCGGSIDVLITPVPAAAAARPVLAATLADAAAGRATALVRLLGPEVPPGPRAANAPGALVVRPGGARAGTLGLGPSLDGEAAAAAGRMLAAGRTGTVRAGNATLLVESSLPPPRMLVFGATDIAAALAHAGTFLGYRVTVCDARPVFATPERFPAAHEVVVAWPHRYLAAQADAGLLDARTVVCALTHDAKFEVPLLAVALRLPLAYVGALGSRRTHADRLTRLRAAGVTDAELARLRAPIGLDLGASTPAGTALSITAEITAHRHGATGLPLTGTDTPLHPSPDAVPTTSARH